MSEDKVDVVLARMRADEEAAHKNGLVLAQVSKTFWLVIDALSAVPAGGRTVYHGRVAFGPKDRAACENYIRTYKK